MDKKLIAMYCLLVVIIITLIFSNFYINNSEGFTGYSETLKAALEESRQQDKEAEEEDQLLLPENHSPAPAPAPSSSDYFVNPSVKPPVSSDSVKPPVSSDSVKPPVSSDKTSNKPAVKDSINADTNNNNNSSSMLKESFQTLGSDNKHSSKKRNNNKVFEHIFSDANSSFKLK